MQRLIKLGVEFALASNHNKLKRKGSQNLQKEIEASVEYLINQFDQPNTIVSLFCVALSLPTRAETQY